jgi:hypothetical protein
MGPTDEHCRAETEALEWCRMHQAEITFAPWDNDLQYRVRVPGSGGGIREPGYGFSLAEAVSVLKGAGG